MLCTKTKCRQTDFFQKYIAVMYISIFFFFGNTFVYLGLLNFHASFTHPFNKYITEEQQKKKLCTVFLLSEGEIRRVVRV